LLRSNSIVDCSRDENATMLAPRITDERRKSLWNLKQREMRVIRLEYSEGKRMASGHTGNVVPGNRLRVRLPCPPLDLIQAGFRKSAEDLPRQLRCLGFS